MNEETLTKQIQELLETKREDCWWDFKREHHHDKATLVHDIICMANNRSQRDSYIIFGVADETYEVIGVSNNDRRNQQKITDILKSVHFAGGVRPRIEVHTITLKAHELDVLIIKNSTEVPYYLEKEYKDKNVTNQDGKPCGKIIQPYHIYTRVVDTNTPIDKQADINDVEFLWRKRFGIDLTIMERLNILLNDIDKWTYDWGNRNYCYHIDFPEFQILLAEDMKQTWDPAAAFYLNNTMYAGKLNIMYHNTIIYESELWSFDEFRKYLPKAKICNVNNMSFWYRYYLLDSIEGKMLKIFTDGSCNISSRDANYNQLLIFESENEKTEFDFFISEHFNDHSDDEINTKYQLQIQNEKKDNLGDMIYSTHQVAKIAWLYEDWQAQLAKAGYVNETF